MKQIWGSAGLSIIVLPRGKQGQDIYEVAKLWTELRILGPALWVREAHLKRESGDPMGQAATAVGVNGAGSVIEVDVDLFQQLARQELPTVRLLAVRTAVPDEAFDVKQNSFLKVIIEYLNYSMPGGGAGGARTEARNKLQLLNLITGPTQFTQDGGTRLGGLEFNANFVAAAEDRATPHSADAFVRYSKDSKRFAGFTLMHIASIAAILQGLPTGSYELLKAGVAQFGENAFVSRVFLSAILTDGLARRAATRVLERAADPYLGVVDLTRQLPIEGTYNVEADQQQAFIDQLVQNTFEFDNSVISYRRPGADPAQGPKAWDHWWQQLVDFFKFAWDKLIRIPYFAGLWLWRRFVRILNAVFQAGGKGAAFTKEPEEKLDARDIAVKAEYERVKETKSDADKALVSPVTPSPVRSTPELWQKLRRMLFAILDGSQQPSDQFGFKREEGKVPVFNQVSSVFPNPGMKKEYPDVVSGDRQALGWSAISDSTELQAAISKKVEELSAQVQAKQSEAGELNLKTQELSKKIAELKEHLIAIEPVKDDGAESSSQPSEVAK
jgi:hypothetical protein